MTLPATPLARLRLIGLLEGSSFLALLLIAMPLKYLAGQPLAVRAVGMAHGVLFLLYLLALVPVALDRRWGWKTCAYCRFSRTNAWLRFLAVQMC